MPSKEWFKIFSHQLEFQKTFFKPLSSQLNFKFLLHVGFLNQIDNKKKKSIPTTSNLFTFENVFVCLLTLSIFFINIVRVCIAKTFVGITNKQELKRKYRKLKGLNIFKFWLSCISSPVNLFDWILIWTLNKCVRYEIFAYLKYNAFFWTIHDNSCYELKCYWYDENSFCLLYIKIIAIKV